MNSFIDYVNLIFSYVTSILDSIKLPGSPSLLKFFLVSIILVVIIKMIKGTFSEFDNATNFMNRAIFYNSFSNYRQKNIIRKSQVVKFRSHLSQEKVDSFNSINYDWLNERD